MATDYTLLTKPELIALLRSRDANPQDMEVLQLRIDRKTETIQQQQNRNLEIDEISKLTADERDAAKSIHLAKIAELQADVTRLQEILAGMPAAP